MPHFERVVRILVIISILFSSVPPMPISAGSTKRPGYQTGEPAATDTPPPPATDTPTPIPTDTATALPTDTSAPTGTATTLPSDTPTPVQTETPPETAVPIPTDAPTVVPEVTETATPAALPPTVDFAATPISGSTPLTVTFVNSSTNATHFFWDFGDSLTQTETISAPLVPPSFLRTTHLYTQSGVYTISLTAVGPGGSQTLTKTNYLTVSEPVLADFSAFPTTGPSPLTVQFFDNSTGASRYNWDFGDGSTLLTTDGLTDTLINPSHTYTQAGVYTVTLVVANAVSTDTLVKPAYITVTEELAADFSATPLFGSQPLTVTFANHSTKATGYLWDFGDGETSTDFEPAHVYSQAGVYTVTLQANGPDRTDTLVRSHYLTVTQPISVAFSAFPYRAEAPALIQFLNNSSGVIEGYDWDFGDRVVSTLPSPTHTYTTAGSYTVTLTANGPDDSRTLTKTGYLTITAPIEVRVTKPDDQPEPHLPVYVFNEVTYTGDSQTTDNRGVVAFSLSAGAYRFRVEKEGTEFWSGPANHCLVPGCTVVTMTLPGPALPPVADFAAPFVSGTAPLAVTFVNSSTNAASYIWDFGDTITSTEVSPSHTYTEAGVYTVTLTATSADGVSTSLVKTNYLTVTSAVAADFSAFPLDGSLPLLVQFLNNSTGADSYIWAFGDGITSTLPSPTHTYTASGVYTVSLIATGAGGTSPMTRTNYITVTAPLVADFSAGSVSGTTPLTVTFSNSSTYATDYQWDFGDGTPGSTAISPTHVYTQPGTYTVTLIADNDVSAGTAKAEQITVFAPGPAPARLASTPSDLLFIENVGQFDSKARFMVRGTTGNLFLADDALWLTLLEDLPADQLAHRDKAEALRQQTNRLRRGVNLKLSFPGANPHARIEPFNRLETKVSYFIGDSSEWRPDVPVWGGVRYVDFYPGVDLEITGQKGQLVQRLVVRQMPRSLLAKPGEGWGKGVRLRLEGMDALALDSQALRLTTAIGDFALPLLQAVSADGRPLAVPMAAPKVNSQEITAPFAPAPTVSASPSIPLRPAGLAAPLPLNLLAPMATGAADLIYGTFLGGSSDDFSQDIAVDGSGNAYVTGYTFSSNFPTTAGAFDTTLGNTLDVFVTKLNTTGAALIYSTFLGGGNSEYGYGIAVDGSGNAYVTGYTSSSNFPKTTGAFDTTFGGGTDVFVTKVNATGTALGYSTFLGGNGSDTGYDIAVESNGRAYVTGNASSNFPTTAGAFDTTLGGSDDVFVAKISIPGSTLFYSTFLGAGNHDLGYGVAVDGSGYAYVTGQTYSTNFPKTAGAFDTTFGGPFEGFVTKVNTAGTALSYSTFLGGSAYDTGYDIAVDSSGYAYVTGATNSSDFPTTAGAFDVSLGGSGGVVYDTFVTKVNTTGTALSYSTFLGGSNDESGRGIAVDSSSSAYVTGYTQSSNFPTTAGAFDTSYGGIAGNDAFITKVNTTGTALNYSTFLGGSSYDYGLDIAMDSSGYAYVTGYTQSSGFPTTPGAFDTSLDSYSDAFVTKLAVGVSLAITKSAPATTLAGTPITYTLRITNVGTTAATSLSRSKFW